MLTKKIQKHAQDLSVVLANGDFANCFPEHIPSKLLRLRAPGRSRDTYPQWGLSKDVDYRAAAIQTTFAEHMAFPLAEPQLDTQRRIVATGISQKPYLLNTST
jgi:hypothetical protein